MLLMTEEEENSLNTDGRNSASERVNSLLGLNVANLNRTLLCVSLNVNNKTAVIKS